VWVDSEHEKPADDTAPDRHVGQLKQKSYETLYAVPRLPNVTTKKALWNLVCCPQAAGYDHYTNNYETLYAVPRLPNVTTKKALWNLVCCPQAAGYDHYTNNL